MPKKLPDPIKVASIADAEFSVYLAKDFFKNKYSSPECLRILKIARRSYWRYGDVALLDSYDKKSLIYLIRARYNTKLGTKNIPTEEWLSLRFTPGSGLPQLTEDFSHNLANGKPLKHLFQKKLFPKIKDFSKHVVTISRLCKIPPKFIGQTNSQSDNFRKNKYTLQCLCIASQIFLEQQAKDHKFLYITALFREEVLSKSLSTTKYGLSKAMFQDGHKILGIKNPADIKIKRYPFTYKYPGYFLDTDDTLKLLEKLLLQGHISKQTLRHYTNNESEHPKTIKSHHLGKMFSEKGKLRFSTIGAHQLRKMANKEIKDGPSLKITPIKDWTDNVESILRIL